MLINEIILLGYILYLCLCLLKLELSVVEVRCLEGGSTSNLGLPHRIFQKRMVCCGSPSPFLTPALQSSLCIALR